MERQERVASTSRLTDIFHMDPTAHVVAVSDGETNEHLGWDVTWDDGEAEQETMVVAGVELEEDDIEVLRKLIREVAADVVHGIEFTEIDDNTDKLGTLSQRAAVYESRIDQLEARMQRLERVARLGCQQLGVSFEEV